MPCSDGGWGRAIVDESRIKKIDELTDMLCRVLGRLEAGYPFIVDLDIADWYVEHKTEDLKRGDTKC